MRCAFKESVIYQLHVFITQEAYSVARQFNLIPPIAEQAEYHLFQREKVEMQMPELYHKIGKNSLVAHFNPCPYSNQSTCIIMISLRCATISTAHSFYSPAA